MNEDWDKTFRHVTVHVDRLGEVFGLKGRPTSVWVEDYGQYLHILFQMADDTGHRVAPGGYVEEETLRSEVCTYPDGTRVKAMYLGQDERPIRTQVTPNADLALEPFEVGDTVEVDGVKKVIEHVGGDFLVLRDRFDNPVLVEKEALRA